MANEDDIDFYLLYLEAMQAKGKEILKQRYALANEYGRILEEKPEYSEEMQELYDKELDDIDLIIDQLELVDSVNWDLDSLVPVIQDSETED